MKNFTRLVLCVALGTLVAAPAMAQKPGGGRGKPPAEALEACASLAEESACEFTGRGDTTLNGMCHTVRSGELACVPAGHTRGEKRGDRDDSAWHGIDCIGTTVEQTARAVVPCIN